MPQCGAGALARRLWRLGLGCVFQDLGWQVSFGNSWLAGLGHQAAPGRTSSQRRRSKPAL